jgi:hypothetical protein
VPSSPRDNDATWQRTDTLCRERDWSQQHLLHELANGLPYRTDPPGWTVRWGSHFWPYLNVKASTLLVPPGGMAGIEPPPSTKHSDLFTWGALLRIEVWQPDPPAKAEVPSPAANVPAVSPAPPPKKVSKAEVERCLRDIMKERPSNPLNEGELFAEVKHRLGASPGRDRLRQLRREIAPQWKRPVGAPRNFNSAKKSAE